MSKRQLNFVLFLLPLVELYGRQPEVRRALQRRDYGAALSLCSEVAGKDYQMLPGITSTGFRAARDRKLKQLNRLCSAIAELDRGITSTQMHAG